MGALKLLVYEALSFCCMRCEATSVEGLKLLVYEALSYKQIHQYIHAFRFTLRESGKSIAAGNVMRLLS
jgi:translation elongation factor EF-1alpha